MPRWGAAALAVLCLLLPASRAEAGDVHVACVQGQLVALGHEPGPVDGLNGPRTREALRAYVDTLDAARRGVLDALPAFNARSSVGWCREIGLSAPVARAVMPSSTPPQVFIGPDVHPEIADHVMTAFLEAEEFLYRRYGVQVASQVRIIVATNADAWQRLVKEAGTMELQAWADVRARARRDCETEFGLGASASRDGLSFCGTTLALRTPALGELYRMVLSVTMTHEVVHNAQRELSYDKVPRWTNDPDGVRPRMGPAWMVEGSAQVIEQAFMEEKYGRFVPGLHAMRTLAAGSDLTLRQIRLAQEVRESEAYDVSAYAVAMLVERYGEETLFRFWHVVGETDNWFTAFEQVYGMTVQEFEGLYTTLRDDRMAQREFLADRDMNGDQILAHRPLTEAELGQ
ncbi:peptidoglycan-binding domain-containing protein [Antarctobacter sp.]|uniref:peptidoglycan-binding domain-containing protein n=1 Tax=Antarctobacter sp. TaxID=1872577 RepID=UPI002B274F54|nr:peptidoglycan-binding domain-containing protein [Antarctobacter sp.]